MDLSRAAEQQQALDEARAAQAGGRDDLAAAAAAAAHDGEEEQQEANGHAELEQQPSALNGALQDAHRSPTCQLTAVGLQLLLSLLWSCSMLIRDLACSRLQVLWI